MSAPRLVLSRSQRRQIETAARRHWPEECCGILIGRRDGATSLVSRAIDVRNARSAARERGYEVAAVDLVAAHRAARERGEEIVGFYHSHPEGGSRPSLEDLAQAWPHTSYLIAVLVGDRCALASWRRPTTGTMAREELAP